MQIERVLSPEPINAVMNHPDVRPWVTRPGDGALDLTPVVADRRNVVLMGEHGGSAIHWLMGGLYEVHTAILPDGRGKWALDFAHAASKWMFTHTDATEITTKVPVSNRAAFGLTKAIPGTMIEFLLPDFWTRQDGGKEGAYVFALRIEDWMRLAPGLVERGEEFHERLYEKADAIGLAVERHDDETHNRYVGAAAEMILGGQAIKGVIFYNRWAFFANAPRMGIVSRDPFVLHTPDCKFKVVGDDFEVIRHA